MIGLSLELEDGAPLRVLCLGAHCDDIEIGAGATVRRLIREVGRSRPVHVHWEVLASTPEREAEARASAAEVLEGAAQSSVEVRTFRESYFPDQWSEIKDHMFEVRSSFTPDLVLSHHRQDRHQDHGVVAELTWNTFRDHLILEYEIPKYEGDLGRPNFFVRLEAAAASEKIESLRRHFLSQADKPWFDAETFRALMRLRGVESNAPYAEAFHASKICF